MSAPRQPSLDLGGRSGPIARPTLVYFAGGQSQLEALADIAAIAARVAALNPDAEAIEVSAQAWPQAYPGLDVFFGWSLYAWSGAEKLWIGVAALPEPDARTPATRAALQAALDAVRPRRAAA